MIRLESGLSCFHSDNAPAKEFSTILLKTMGIVVNNYAHSSEIICLKFLKSFRVHAPYSIVEIG
jgi:hypothetical protein